MSSLFIGKQTRKKTATTGTNGKNNPKTGKQWQKKSSGNCAKMRLRNGSRAKMLILNGYQSHTHERTEHFPIRYRARSVQNGPKVYPKRHTHTAWCKDGNARNQTRRTKIETVSARLGEQGAPLSCSSALRSGDCCTQPRRRRSPPTAGRSPHHAFNEK